MEGLSELDSLQRKNKLSVNMKEGDLPRIEIHHSVVMITHELTHEAYPAPDPFPTPEGLLAYSPACT